MVELPPIRTLGRLRILLIPRPIAPKVWLFLKAVFVPSHAPTAAPATPIAAPATALPALRAVLNGSAAILAAAQPPFAAITPPFAANVPPSFAAFIAPIFVTPPARPVASAICWPAAIAEFPESAPKMILLALLTAKAPPIIKIICAI